MSALPPPTKRLSVPGLLALKGVRPIVCLTAYTAPVARRLDPHVDLLLIGDSLGMVIYGEDSTLPVGLDDMIRHGRAVVRASSRALVVVDMPFGSYQASKAQAFRHAAKILKETGASAVKLEGGEEMAETVAFLTARAVPVMGHVGLMPQHVHALGGYRWQGRTDAERRKVMGDARAISDAGAFALVIEGVAAPIAREITGTVNAATIGIGAGPGCDGQILVVDDMAGLTEITPKFVRRFAETGETLERAATDYAAAVRSGEFPSAQQSYGVAAVSPDAAESR